MANNKYPTENSALLRGLSVLECVAQAERGLSLSELMVALSLPKSTLHRLALQLESTGYLQRVPDKRFVIGSALKNLAISVFANQSVLSARHAVLQALSQEVGETCNCSLMNGQDIIYFDRVECHWPIKVDLHPGSRLPLHATASGKLFLAYMAPRKRQYLLKTLPLTRYTQRTLVNRMELEQELAYIRDNKVGFDNEELFDDMVAIAVPVFDEQQRICFTVAMHAPTTRKTIADLWQYVPRLRQAADDLAASYVALLDE